MKTHFFASTYSTLKKELWTMQGEGETRTYKSHFIFVHGIVGTARNEGVALFMEMFAFREMNDGFFSYRIKFDRFR